MDGLVCWQCGAAVNTPIGRLDECVDCNAELHVCRQCEFYDKRAPAQCSEELAEPPLEKHRANFCEYFQPAIGAYRGHVDNSAAQAARARLEALFGNESAIPPAAPADDEELSEAERARRELERLFDTKRS